MITITISEIGLDGYWTGASAEITAADPCPKGWTRATRPELGESQALRWDNGWVVSGQPAPVLPNLTMRQFRLGLLSAGLLAGVEAAIDGLAEPERSAARIELEYAGEVVRTDPWVTTLAGVMGLTAEEIDTLWLWAAAL